MTFLASPSYYYRPAKREAEMNVGFLLYIKGRVLNGGRRRYPQTHQNASQRRTAPMSAMLPITYSLSVESLLPENQNFGSAKSAY